MKLGSKHRTKEFVFSNFTGGINFTYPPDMLNPNEAVMIQNFEFDPSNATLKVRDGLKLIAIAEGDIDTLFYSKTLDLILFSIGTSLYKYDFNVFTEIGTLSGDKIPVFAEWADKVLVASGGKLQSTDGATLTTIDSSPECDYVNVQYGRVIISKQGQDYLYWSGVGDETNWNFSGTEGDALRLEVGYKDGGNILAVKMLSKDIVVFKDNRRIYRVIGVYPDWLVYQVSQDSGLISKFAVAEVGNSLIFMDQDGVKSLDTVMEYGDMKTREIGEKVNTWIRSFDPASVRLWHVKPKGQVWVKIKDDEFVYVFHYFNGAWVVFRFPVKATAVTWGKNAVYVACKDKLYKMDSNATTDDGVAIQARLLTRRIQPEWEFLLKRVKIFYQGLSSGTVNFKMNKISKNLDVIPSGDIAYLDDDIAYYDDDPVVQQGSNLVQFRCNHRLPYLQPELTVTEGSIKLLGLALEVAGV